MSLSISDLLRDSGYSDGLFSAQEISALDLKVIKGKPYVHDPVSGIDRPAKPEEIVRQLFLRQLLGQYGYPASRIGVEKAVQMGRDTSKSADIVVYDADDHRAVYLIVEVKRPGEKGGLEQLKSYCNAEGAPLAALTDGAGLLVLHREDPNIYIEVPRLPHAAETLEEVLEEEVTLDDLKERNRLVTEGRTLKGIILDLENLVLANAGVNSFEEIFKLLYAKLYDEWAAANERPDRRVTFRIGGATDAALKRKIDGLFREATDKWRGVFDRGEHVKLDGGQLRVCVSFLQNVKLFNSNLQVIDDAFEYLTVSEAKGKKGQYFTPRHVIDMAVKMLDPKRHEYVVDTAAGSCGFTVHALFHVWGEEFTAERPEPWQINYAREKVYALDFDARSVKVARALNLIAGDGQTNVYQANTLDPKRWRPEVAQGLKPRLRRFPDDAATEKNAADYRHFDFHVLLANPPFAGDVSDSRILRQYDLARKYKAVDPSKLTEGSEEWDAYHADPHRHAFLDARKWHRKQPRDVLFLERNLDFLRPGGRAALVLPQGRFNNVSDAYLRWWLAPHARILAVVGLHVDTFKPHTGTKTSVLFLQKWNDDPSAGPLCPRVDDYPVFFATSEVSGKNSKGEAVYLVDPDDGGPLLDIERHPVVDHDLFSVKDVLAGQMRRFRKRHRGQDELIAAKEEEHARILGHLPVREPIAEAFLDFARAEGLSFISQQN